MSISVGVANPGTISSVGNASPGTISGTSVAPYSGTLSVAGTSQPYVINTGSGTTSTPSYTPPPAYSAPAPVYAPKLDLAAINAQARQSAEGAVNPYYTKVLNEFLTQQASKRQQQQTQYETNVKNLQDQLKNTLEQNDITKGRTTEDVAKNEADINQTADQFQTDAGQAFDANRLELAKDASTGGLGAQKTEAATTARNTQEKRQEQKFQQHREQQELFKTRTFADLARSGDLAKIASEKGQTQAKFDLDSYIQNQGFDEQAQRNSLEKQRFSDIATEQARQSKLLFASYLQKISNPAQYEAAVRTYSGSF